MNRLAHFIAARLATGSAGSAGPEIRLGRAGGALGTMHVLGDAFTAATSARPKITSRPLRPSEERPNQEVVEYGHSPFGLVCHRPAVTRLSAREVADPFAGPTTHWPA